MATKNWVRNSRSAVAYIPFAALLVVFIMIFGVGVFFRVVYYEVEGAVRYTEREIIKASGIAVGDSLIFLNTDKAAQYIYSELPYIMEVRISPKHPDTLRLEVREVEAFAAVAYGNGFVVLDSTGRELEKTAALPQGLIELRGFTPFETNQGKKIKVSSADENKFKYALEVMSEAEKRNIQKNISYLDVTNIANITIEYAEKYRIILGSTTNISDKLGDVMAFASDMETSDRSNVTGTYNMSDTTGGGIWSPDR